MKLSEGIKLKGRPAEIPDTYRDDLPAFFKELGYKVGVEIGVDRGEFSEKLCLAGLKVYGVDPWLDYPDYSTERIQDRLDNAESDARERLKPFPDYVFLKMTSMEALSQFEDNSLDFVYIDGHHGFKYVAEDLYEWSKKVKKSGIVAGHDYMYAYKHRMHPYTCHVKQVVDAFTASFGVKQWYVLGERNSPNRDRFRSFFWFNKYD